METGEPVSISAVTFTPFTVTSEYTAGPSFVGVIVSEKDTPFTVASSIATTTCFSFNFFCSAVILSEIILISFSGVTTATAESDLRVSLSLPGGIG